MNILQQFDTDTLDPFERKQYDNMIDGGIGKDNALQILINNVEGDYSELSTELEKLAKTLE